MGHNLSPKRNKYLHTFSYLTRYANLGKAILDTEEFVENLRESIDAISNLFIGGHRECQTIVTIPLSTYSVFSSGIKSPARSEEHLQCNVGQ